MAPSANRMLVSAVLAAATYSASQLITAFVASPAAASAQPVHLRPRGSVALQATDPTQTLHTPYTPYTHPTPYTPVVLEIALYSEELNKAKLELEQKFQESEAGRQGLQARIAELESQLAARADSGTSAMPTSRNSVQSLPQAAAAAIPPPTSINSMQQQQQLQQQLQQQKQQKQQQHQLQQRQERIQRRQQQSLPQAAAAAIPPTHTLHTRGGGEWDISDADIEKFYAELTTGGKGGDPPKESVVGGLIVKFFHGEFTPQGFKRYAGHWKGPPPGNIGKKDIAVGMDGLTVQMKNPMFVTKGGVGYGVDETLKVVDDGKGWVWLAAEMSPGGLAIELFKSVPFGKRALLVAKQSDVEEMFSKVNWAVALGNIEKTFGGPLIKQR
ncbi:unnamed protein product [Polarella glacialis]|uniref:Uncharacterized protein n=1 Tax=Polarella glacialis TaxID=89957 RepID=A0A813K7W6_POLGL|nr:unnamed protein product [Polarella glacialis]